MADAIRTERLARSAARRGDLRLAVSRGITAVIQATRVAQMRGDNRSLDQADAIIQNVRDLVQGAVLKRAAARLRKLG